MVEVDLEIRAGC